MHHSDPKPRPLLRPCPRPLIHTFLQGSFSEYQGPGKPNTPSRSQTKESNATRLDLKQLAIYSVLTADLFIFPQQNSLCHLSPFTARVHTLGAALYHLSTSRPPSPPPTPSPAHSSQSLSRQPERAHVWPDKAHRGPSCVDIAQ